MASANVSTRVKKPSAKQTKILERAFTQANMKVISQIAIPIGGDNAQNGYNINFSILGNTGNIYKVGFTLNTTDNSDKDGDGDFIDSDDDECHKPSVSCTCPYYLTRDEVCKHIYVVYIKVFRVLPEVITSSPTLSLGQRQLLVSLYKNYVAENIAPPTGETSSRNCPDDDCPVCFEKLSTSTYTCHQCRNSIHKECMREVVKYNNHCPLCRADIDESLAEMMSLLRI